MTSSVIAIGSKVGSISDASELFRVGRFNEALVALRRFDTAEAAILRAHALLRVDRPEEARAECLRLSIDEPSMDLIAEALIVRAYVELRLSNVDVAQGLIDEARTYVYSAACAALEAEFLNLEARVAFYRGSDDVCEARSQAILAVCEPFGLPERARPIASLSTSRARAYEMLGFLRVRAGDSHEYLECLTRAAEMIGSDPKADISTKAVIAVNLAYAVREVEPTAARLAYVAAFAASISWTPDLISSRFKISHAMGWIAAVDGDHVGALRSFREAARVASNPYEVLACHVDRAYLARELGQELFAREEIAEALDVVERLDLRNPYDEYFAFLPMLAQLISLEDPARAEELLATYDDARTRTDSRYAGKLDTRRVAIVAFARAKIAMSRNRANDALPLLEEARATWVSLGCAWRAGLVAAELARIDASYAPLAEAERRSRPRSFYARSIVELAS